MYFIKSGSQFQFMLQYLLAQRDKLLVLFVLILGNVFLQIYSPHYIQQFIDGAKAGKETTVLLTTAGIFLILTLGRQVLIVVVQLVTIDITWKISNQLRFDLTKLCLN